MVNDSGQLYTIEGLAAGLIMIATAYIVLGSTIVYTPGDTHIADMQLETLGNDALRMMDTPQNLSQATGKSSPLTTILTKTTSGSSDEVSFDGTTFHDKFSFYCNATAVQQNDDNIQFYANVTYRNTSGGLGQYFINSSRNMTGREHAVRVTKWVKVDEQENWDRPQFVLVEVLLWRA